MSRLLLLVLCVAAMSNAYAQAVPNDEAISRRRSLSNAAIARHDTGGIGATMAEDIIVVTSRSAQSIGRAANMASFAEQFRTRHDVVYVRTPERIQVYEPWGMASEYGRWVGSWTDTDGKIQIGGSYFAKWRLKNGTWFIESETYVPERCTGSKYCATPP